MDAGASSTSAAEQTPAVEGEERMSVRQRRSMGMSTRRRAPKTKRNLESFADVRKQWQEQIEQETTSTVPRPFMLTRPDMAFSRQTMRQMRTGVGAGANAFFRRQVVDPAMNTPSMSTNLTARRLKARATATFFNWRRVRAHRAPPRAAATCHRRCSLCPPTTLCAYPPP